MKFIFNKVMAAVLLVLCLTVCVTVPAFAVTPSTDAVTATMGDQNSSGAYRVASKFDGTNGYIQFASDTGMLFPYTTGSTTYTITAAQSGNVIVFNNGSGTAANGTTFLLPTAQPGMRYTIIADIAKWFYVDAQSTDTINFSTATAGQRISNSATAAAGDNIILYCATAGSWSVGPRVGTWAVGPGQ